MSDEKRKEERWTRRDLVRAAGASAVTFMLPLSVSLGAAPAERPASSRQPMSNGFIDDLWTGYPRYAEPIGYAKAHAGAFDPHDHL